MLQHEITGQPIGVSVFPEAITQLKGILFKAIKKGQNVLISKDEIFSRVKAAGNEACANYWKNFQGSEFEFTV